MHNYVLSGILSFAHSNGLLQRREEKRREEKRREEKRREEKRTEEKRREEKRCLPRQTE